MAEPLLRVVRRPLDPNGEEALVLPETALVQPLALPHAHAVDPEPGLGRAVAEQEHRSVAVAGGEIHLDLVPGPAVDETAASPGYLPVPIALDLSSRRYDGILTADLGEAAGPVDTPGAAEPRRRDVARRGLREQFSQPLHEPVLADQSGQVGLVEPPMQQVDSDRGTGQPVLPLRRMAAPALGHPLLRRPLGGGSGHGSRVHRRCGFLRLCLVGGHALRRLSLRFGFLYRFRFRFPWPLHGSTPRSRVRQAADRRAAPGAAAPHFPASPS